VRTHELEGSFRPTPSPDGRWLVYATRFDAREALKLLNLTNGEEHWLKMDVQRDDHQGGGARDRDVYPGSAFTPDSRALITSYGGKIMRVEIPSGDATVIPFTAEVEQELSSILSTTPSSPCLRFGARGLLPTVADSRFQPSTGYGWQTFRTDRTAWL